LVEYGDFQCSDCGQAESVIRDLLADFGDLRYVWRHLPLNDVHIYAQTAAEASEAAAAQGKFWEMYDLLLAHQDALHVRALISYAEELELDVERFRQALRKRKYEGRIAEDVESADAVASPARRRSSSTIAGTTGPMTSTRCRPKCGQPRARAAVAT